MVVDDDDDIRFSTVRILKSEGFNVIATDSGENCLDIVSPEIDLVLLDVVMPGIDGYETCRKLKSDPRLINLFVVLASGSKITNQEQTTGLNTGADGYITRPMAKAELIARIRSFIRIIQTKRKIRENDLWLETTLNSIGDSVIATNNKGKITYINPAAEKLLGWELSEIINTSADNILHIKDIETGIVKKNIIAKFIENSDDQAKQFECIFFTRHGKSLYVSFSVNSIKDINLDVTGTVIVIRDISEQKTAEIELKKYKDNLEAMVADRTEKLIEQNKQLEHYYDLFIKREFRIKELRNKIEELESQI